MKIVNRKNIKPIKDACGKLQEMYASKNISVSYSIIMHHSKAHKHKITEEIYFIMKGKADLVVDKKIFKIKAGDVFAIPKNKYHFIKNVKKTIELVVITNPKFDKKDLIY